MRSWVSLLVIAIVTTVTTAGGEVSGSERTLDKRASSNAKLIPREYGWGEDKIAPALRIRDEDREKPARQRPEWIEWRQTLGSHRTYHNASHEELSARIFEQTEILVEINRKAFDGGEVSYRLGINALADLTEEEFKMMTMREGIFETFPGPSTDESTDEDVNSQERAPSFPAQYDWRSRITLPAIKNQGLCGCCYSFSAMAAIEAQIAWKRNVTVSLSDQFGMDCTENVEPTGHNSGCQGGWQRVIFKWLMSTQRGIPTTAQCGYLEREGKCPPDSVDYVYKLKSYNLTNAPDEAFLPELLILRGPFTCILAAAPQRQFKDYSSGVYDNIACNDYNINHAVLAVGYGTQNGKDFWTLRNSWGASWGEHGYMKLRRGVRRCHFTYVAEWPVLDW